MTTHHSEHTKLHELAALWVHVRREIDRALERGLTHYEVAKRLERMVHELEKQNDKGRSNGQQRTR